MDHAFWFLEVDNTKMLLRKTWIQHCVIVSHGPTRPKRRDLIVSSVVIMLTVRREYLKLVQFNRSSHWRMNSINRGRDATKKVQILKKNGVRQGEWLASQLLMHWNMASFIPFSGQNRPLPNQQISQTLKSNWTILSKLEAYEIKLNTFLIKMCFLHIKMGIFLFKEKLENFLDLKKISAPINERTGWSIIKLFWR